MHACSDLVQKLARARCTGCGVSSVAQHTLPHDHGVGPYSFDIRRSHERSFVRCLRRSFPLDAQLGMGQSAHGMNEDDASSNPASKIVHVDKELQQLLAELVERLGTDAQCSVRGNSVFMKNCVFHVLLHSRNVRMGHAIHFALSRGSSVCRSRFHKIP